ncbi:MAG: hypothetical protein WCD44_01375, partial [Candidatus Babeliales bacterium]
MHKTKKAIIIFSIFSLQIQAQNNLFSEQTEYNETKEIFITRARSNIQVWRPIQKQIRDTVLQIFSSVAEFDWLQPYKTPN